MSSNLMNQYFDNVVEKFASAFFRQSPFDGPGTCMVTYSRELTVVKCYTDNEFYKPLFWGFCLFIGVNILVWLVRKSCCN